jgi:hypothetical protein
MPLARLDLDELRRDLPFAAPSARSAGRLFRKYVALFVAVIALLANGLAAMAAGQRK